MYVNAALVKQYPHLLSGKFHPCEVKLKKNWPEEAGFFIEQQLGYEY